MARGVSILVLVTLFAAGLSGCLDQQAMPEASETAGTLAATPARPVVVAQIDSGITPYHDFFRAGPGRGAEVFAEVFGAEVIPLTQEGTLGERLEADAAVWESLQRGKLYAFAGTRVLAVSMGQSTDDIPPILDALDHGTATASLILREAPESLVVIVQIDARFTLEPSLHLASAFEWIGAQPWMDIASMSVGLPGNPPRPTVIDEDAGPSLAASRRLWESGKLVVAAAGNTAVPPLTSYIQGPPWVIAVGGAQSGPRGDATYASRGADVVANYTDMTVDSSSTEDMHWAAGTSYAAPIVSGTLARALGEVRAQGLEAQDLHVRLRAALNATAIHFGATEWSPRKTPGSGDDIYYSSTSLPVLAPPVQQGWGYVDGSLAQEVARRVLENDLSIPPEKAQTAAYMAQWQSLRERYWQHAP